MPYRNFFHIEFGRIYEALMALVAADVRLTGLAWLMGLWVGSLNSCQSLDPEVFRKMAQIIRVINDPTGEALRQFERLKVTSTDFSLHDLETALQETAKFIGSIPSPELKQAVANFIRRLHPDTAREA